MVSIDNHYDVLGVPQNATIKDIKVAYRELAKSLHPDKNKFGAQLFKRINEAHETLSDPLARAIYDNGQRVQMVSTPPPTKPRAATPTPASDEETSSYDGAKSPPRKQSKKENSNTRDHKWKQRLDSASFTCPICLKIVKKDFVEAPCCGSLCCVECIEEKYLTTQYGHRNYGKKSVRCPKQTCQAPIQNIHLAHFGWNRSKFLQNLLEEIAPTHACGEHVFRKDLKEHERVCPKLNHSCFKCLGKGKLKLGHHEVQCDSCNGAKVLPGLDWLECFKCQGRGAFNTTSNNIESCSTCMGKGALQGKWTICFKCNGVGGHMTPKKTYQACSTCNGKGAIQGFNLEECAKCKGRGCKSCNWMGAVRCRCGQFCKGHAKAQHVVYPEDDYYYDSDSSDSTY